MFLCVFLVLHAQFGLPNANKCCGEHMCVHWTGPCGLNKCGPRQKVCAQFIANLCDCENGFKFDSSIGKCVKPEKCGQGNAPNGISSTDDCDSTTTTTASTSDTCIPKNCTTKSQS